LQHFGLRWFVKQLLKICLPIFAGVQREKCEKWCCIQVFFGKSVSIHGRSNGKLHSDLSVFHSTQTISWSFWLGRGISRSHWLLQLHLGQLTTSSLHLLILEVNLIPSTASSLSLFVSVHFYRQFGVVDMG
jgi:hypothetical protein